MLILFKELNLKETKLEFHHKQDKSIKTLVELGANGYFPLFENNWLQDVSNPNKKLTGNEKVKAKNLFKRVLQHKSIERKKTVVFSMCEEDRVLFIKAFLKMVEGNILDKKIELH